MILEKLKEQGYEVENCEIISADLFFEDHGCFTMQLRLKGNGWGQSFGGINLGYKDYNTKKFKNCNKGIEYIATIMSIVGVNHFKDLKGKCIRIAKKNWSDTIKIIGNLIEDKWFDVNEFFQLNKNKTKNN